MADHARTHRWLAIVAGALGVLALAGGDPYPAAVSRSAEPGARSVTAVDLARWIRDGGSAVRLIHVRSDSQFAAYHIPGAEHVAPNELPGLRWSRDETIVISADDDARAERAAAVLRGRGAERTHVLRGGLLAWIEQLAEPRLAALPTTATASERAARREHLELSRYFGGMPVVLPAGPASAPPGAAPVPARRAEAAAVGRILRRGC